MYFNQTTLLKHKNVFDLFTEQRQGICQSVGYTCLDDPHVGCICCGDAENSDALRRRQVDGANPEPKHGPPSTSLGHSKAQPPVFPLLQVTTASSTRPYISVNFKQENQLLLEKPCCCCQGSEVKKEANSESNQRSRLWSRSGPNTMLREIHPSSLRPPSDL